MTTNVVFKDTELYALIFDKLSKITEVKTNGLSFLEWKDESTTVCSMYAAWKDASMRVHYSNGRYFKIIQIEGQIEFKGETIDFNYVPDTFWEGLFGLMPGLNKILDALPWQFMHGYILNYGTEFTFRGNQFSISNYSKDKPDFVTLFKNYDETKGSFECQYKVGGITVNKVQVKIKIALRCRDYLWAIAREYAFQNSVK